MSIRSLPVVTPCRCKYATMKLRTVLHVIAEHKFRLCAVVIAHILREEWSNYARKRQTGLYIILYIVLVLVSVKPLNCLIGTTELYGEELASPKYVVVGISQCGSSAEVAFGIGTFWLEGYSIGLTCAYLDTTIKQSVFLVLIKVYVGEPYSIQTRKIVICSVPRQPRICCLPLL